MIVTAAVGDAAASSAQCGLPPKPPAPPSSAGSAADLRRNVPAGGDEERNDGGDGREESSPPPPPPPCPAAPPPPVARAASEFRRSVQSGAFKSLVTDREMLFLESLAEGGDERDMALAGWRLGNKGVFFEGEEGEGGGDGGGGRGKGDRSTARRERYLTERQKAQLHGILWKAHDERVASAAQSRWRRGVRRIVALRGLAKAPPPVGLAAKGESVAVSAEGEKEKKDVAEKDEKEAEEKKVEEREREERRSALFDRSGLMVRMASIYQYGLRSGTEGMGEGFEVGDADMLIWGAQGQESEPNDAEESKNEREHQQHHNAWDILKRCKSPDSGGDGHGDSEPPPFLILGTSADDAKCHPHVLSPPLMEALRSSFPFALSEDNFWIKYSLVRDGSSLISLLQNSRASKHTVIAVETVDGEVFGSFTSMPWRKTHGYFGNGQSFLWRMCEPRTTSCASVEEQAKLEGDVEVFKWTGVDDVVQICGGGHIAVGGGGGVTDVSLSGFGFMIEDDLLRGSSGPCETFGNPCLCPRSTTDGDGGGVFEIANLEVWTTTPFMFAEDAERNEMMKMFLEENQST